MNRNLVAQKLENCNDIALLKSALFNVLAVCDASEVVHQARQRHTTRSVDSIPKVWVATIREAVIESIDG